jgi:Prefoldin subunit
MLQYKFEEAHALLRKNLHSAQEKRDSLNETLDFIKEQCITTQVNMSRLYNYQVQLRRESKLR